MDGNQSGEREAFLRESEVTENTLWGIFGIGFHCDI